MSAQLDEFKEFVKLHPGLRELIVRDRRTWQSIYEEWTLYRDSDVWDQYADPTQPMPRNKTGDNVSPKVKELKPEGSTSNMEDMIKNAFGYVKKINPDSITKTVSGIQKILALVTGLGIGGAAGKAASNKMTGDPLFDRKLDEWY